MQATVAVRHTAACQVTFHNYCKMIERPWVPAAVNLLPLLPLDHFAINCRSFKRFKLQFSQNKTIILSNLKMQGCGREAGYDNALILSGL